MRHYILWAVLWTAFFAVGGWFVFWFLPTIAPTREESERSYQKNTLEPSLPKGFTDLHYISSAWYTFKWRDQCFLIGNAGGYAETLTTIKCEN